MNFNILAFFAVILSSSIAYSETYDHYVLATKWQGTACQFQDCIKSEIDKVSQASFNLHGLWPSNSQGKQPQNCRNSNVLLNKLSKDMSSSLSEFWSGLYGSQEVFLNHEWSKHGSCWAEREFKKGANTADTQSEPKENDVELRQKHKQQKPQKKRDDQHSKPAGSPPTDNDIMEQENYFRISINQSKRYNIFNILKKASITPSNQKAYPFDQINSVISDGLRVRSFVLLCTSKQGKQFIEEIRMCLNLNLDAFECPVALSSGKACKRNLPIYYPEFKSSSKSFLE